MRDNVKLLCKDIPFIIDKVKYLYFPVMKNEEEKTIQNKQIQNKPKKKTTSNSNIATCCYLETCRHQSEVMQREYAI
jgi:hypothetical protein